MIATRSGSLKRTHQDGGHRTLLVAVGMDGDWEVSTVSEVAGSLEGRLGDDRRGSCAGLMSVVALEWEFELNGTGGGWEVERRWWRVGDVGKD